MKIYDIISEQQTDEAFLAPLMAKAAKFLKPTVQAASKSNAAKQAAAKTAAKTYKANKAVVGQALRLGMSKVTRMSSFAFAGLKALGVGIFISDYYKQISRAEKLVASGEMSPEEFQDFRQQQMTILISQLATSTVLFGGLKTVSGFNFLTKIMSKARLTRPIATLFTGVAGAAQLALIYKLQTNEGRKFISDMIGQGIVDDALGGTGVELLDRAKEFVGLASKEEKDAREKRNADKQAEKDAETEKDAQADADNKATKDVVSTNPNNPNVGKNASGDLVWGLNPEFMKK